MQGKYVPPERNESGFHCPHCGVFTEQHWKRVNWGSSYIPSEYKISKCNHCESYSLWVGENMVYPAQSTAPLPAEDMPEEIESEYTEARSIVNESPRAAAALLRLATEKLLGTVGAEGDGPYEMIGDLVEKGVIDDRVQEAYDSLRVYGNESVHPGTIDMSDDSETATKLFDLMNFIVRRTITDEEFVQGMYEDIPDKKKQGIEDRDSP